jgi:hypothetical protein
MAFLKTAPDPPRGIDFARMPFEPFELHLADVAVLPSTLEIGTRGKRVEAYWDGCAWVV